MSQVQIDFAKIEGPVYTGRPRGEALRKKFDLDSIDRSTRTVQVTIPDETYSISSSFFLGMFGDSIVALGSRDAFLQKYSFVANEVFQAVIDSCIGRVLQDKALFAGKR
jgi:hypothetical protein